MNTLQFIDHQRINYLVQQLCQVLGVVPSRYYAWQPLLLLPGVRLWVLQQRQQLPLLRWDTESGLPQSETTG